MPIGTMVNGQHYHALLQDEVSLVLHCTQPELLEHGVILLQDHAKPHHHCDVQNLMQRWGWEVLAHTSDPLDLAPCECLLFASVKKHLQRKLFESEEDINTAVTASLHCLSKLQLIIYHTDGKSLWTIVVITLSGGHNMYTFSNICSAVILYFVITIKS